ncbi:hypothetical protein C0995_008985 [Termitomyces sp. Mi166|nr:hypothetical protein C0995_008985 [Termitomyces sp. Mi166\
MTVDLPLDLPLKDIKTLTSSEIQAIVIKALRLERNWCGCPGRPRQLLQIQRDVVIHQMQHLGSQWLVTLTRSQLAFQLSVISLKDGLCYRIADYSAVSMSFSAVLRSELVGTIVTIEYDGMQTDSAKASSSPFQSDKESYTDLIAHYEAVVPLNGFEFYISAEPVTNSLEPDDTLSILVFPQFIHQKGIGCILRLPLSKQMQPSSSTFKIPPRTTVDVICLGGMGRRAVWLRRHWETDNFELMRGNFSRDGSSKVRSLFPRDMALPFEIQNCFSLAFDEATGRVYVGLHTGGLYVVNF